MIEVRFARLPGNITTIALEGARRVIDAIHAGGYDPEGYTVMVNSEGQRDDEDDILFRLLEDGDIVTITKQIKGN